MLTAEKIARMKATIGTSLIDTVVIKRPGSAVDAEGNPTNVLTTVATVAGRWSAPTSSTRQSFYIGQVLADQAGQQIAGVVTVAAGTDIRPGDMLEVIGKTWRVASVIDARLQQRVYVERVTS